MTENWTQGPWITKIGGLTSWAIAAPYAPLSKHYVAHAAGVDSSVANAHLIAAAPDLYEALKTARSQIVLLGGDAMEDEFGDAIQSAVLGEIDAALSRARGE